MYQAKFSISLINLNTILLFALSYILYKCIIYHYSRNPQWVKFANELPGPRTYPIIGNAIDILIAAKAGYGNSVLNYMNTYGPIFRLWFGPYLTVVVSDENVVETILKSSNTLGRKHVTEPFRIFLGNSLLITAPTAVWKHKRRKLQPFFAKNAVLGRFQEMIEINDKYVEKMRKKADGPEFDLEHYMNDISFDTISKTHYNYDVNDEDRKLQSDQMHKFHSESVSLGFKWLLRSSRLLAIVKWFLPGDLAEMKKLSQDFCDKVINSIPISPNWSEGKDQSATKTINRENLVQSYKNTLYRLQEELNEADLVRSETILSFFGATDTTGNTMSLCLLALAAHQDIQEKVYQEIYQVFGDDDRPVDSSDLNKFPYLKQVIKETQRLFTIVPVILRSPEKDMRIGAHIYPAGIVVALNVIGIHHNPKSYPDPYRFNPENFTPEAINKRHGYSFIPFSAGPRNCIGKVYAEINMTLRLISFLRTFTFHTNVKFEDIKLQTGAGVETSSVGYPVSVKLRRKVS